MPRWAEWIRMPDGTVVHVSHSGPRPKARLCSCGCGRPATLQCDAPLLGGGTCDRYLCRNCGVSRGKDIDYCPSCVIKG
jgi:hypothetical protein